MGYENLFKIRQDEFITGMRQIGSWNFACQDRFLKKLVKGVNLDQPLYRIVSKERFFDACRSRCLSFSKPETWEDPFEAALLYGLELSHHGMGLAHTYQNAVFAQCWSRNAECDGLWRIYAKHTREDLNQGRKQYVQIQTTVRNLLLSILCAAEQYGMFLCGNIFYLGKERILSWMRRLEISGFYERENVALSNPFEAVEAYFLKRDSFSYEQEVRVVFVCGRFREDGCFVTEDMPHPDGHIQVPFNPQCIERVVLDPWTSNRDDVTNIVNEIHGCCEWCNVSGCDLYGQCRTHVRDF